MIIGNDIEKSAQQAFSNFEADVPSDVWTNIQNALPAVPQPSSSAGSSAAGKSSGILSGLNSTAVIISSVALVSMIAGWIYFSPTENNLKQKEIEASVSNETTVQNESAVAQQNINAADAEKNIPSASGSSAIISSDASENNNTSHQQFSANDVVEPAPKQDVTKISGEQIHAAELPSVIDHKADAKFTASTKIENEKPEENNSGSDEETSRSSSPEILTSVNDEASLGQIPNVITPNFDNINDVFIINGTNLKTLNVTISDKSGKTIHRWNNQHGFWDGKLDDGSEAEPGIYFYNIFALSSNGKPVIKKSSFQLIR